MFHVKMFVNFIKIIFTSINCHRLVFNTSARIKIITKLFEQSIFNYLHKVRFYIVI